MANFFKKLFGNSGSQEATKNTRAATVTPDPESDDVYTVCSLCSCLEPEIQANIAKTTLKSRVDFQTENGNTVGVYCKNLRIGMLPDREAKLYAEKGVTLASIVELKKQSTFNTYYTIPKIRIFWGTSKKAPSVTKVTFPIKIEGHPIRYAYVYRFVPVENINVKADILGDSEKIVDVDSDSSRIVLIYNDIVFGYIENEEKAVMVSDFKKKGLPCHAILLSNGEEVNLRFYKDKRFGNEYREQTVCKLTGCKSESKQETISFMDIGDEVDLEEDYEHDDAVIASYQGDPIGKLPKKTALRFLEEGAYAAFLEKLEQDDEFRDIPHIRIYW